MDVTSSTRRRPRVLSGSWCAATISRRPRAVPGDRSRAQSRIVLVERQPMDLRQPVAPEAAQERGVSVGPTRAAAGRIGARLRSGASSRSCKAQARETATGSATVATRRPSSCARLACVPGPHREEQPGRTPWPWSPGSAARRNGNWSSRLCHCDIAASLMSPRSCPEGLQLLEGHRDWSGRWGNRPRRRAGACWLSSSSVWSLKARTSRSARSPGARPRAGRRSARCNTTARTGGCGPARRPRARAPARPRPRPTSGVGHADDPAEEILASGHRPPARERRQEEERGQEQPDAVVGRGVGSIRSTGRSGSGPGSRAAAGRGEPGPAPRPARSPRPAGWSTGTVIPISTQALCQGRLYS